MKLVFIAKDTGKMVGFLYHSRKELTPSTMFYIQKSNVDEIVWMDSRTRVKGDGKGVEDRN